MSTYTLFIANKNYSSWSLRPWILLNELGISFTETLIPFVEKNHAQFKAFAPNARVPCLHDGETVVWDSLAIMEYIAESDPRVWPSDKVARAWARSASAEMHSGFSALRNQCSMNCGLRLKLHETDAALLADIQRIDELWCEGLSRFDGPFLAGKSFSAVDAFFAPVAFRIQTYALPLSTPALAYCQTLLNLTGMKNWYNSAIQEPWREHSHDVDSLSNAALLHDYRAL